MKREDIRAGEYYHNKVTGRKEYVTSKCKILDHADLIDGIVTCGRDADGNPVTYAVDIETFLRDYECSTTYLVVRRERIASHRAVNNIDTFTYRKIASGRGIMLEEWLKGIDLDNIHKGEYLPLGNEVYVTIER